MKIRLVKFREGEDGREIPELWEKCEINTGFGWYFFHKLSEKLL